MSHEIPRELHYSKTHEWIRQEEGETYVVGITDFAQKELGDLVFVELPEAQTQVKSGDEVVVVESVKTASDVYAPLSGQIIETNAHLTSDPAAINQSPYKEGWLFRIKISNPKELESLLDATGYQHVLKEE